ncbi:MAG: PKD domain-containing protein [Balneolaceae bacterium]
MKKKIRSTGFFGVQILITVLLLCIGTIQEAQAQDRPFITTWETTTGNESITIGTNGFNVTDYDFTIDWGDGTVEEIMGNDPDPSHLYATAGTYTVEISGVFPWMYSYQNDDITKLQSIEQWGDIEWGINVLCLQQCRKYDL